MENPEGMGTEAKTFSMFEIPRLSSKQTTNGTVGPTIGQFGDDLEDDGMVSKDWVLT